MSLYKKYKRWKIGGKLSFWGAIVAFFGVPLLVYQYFDIFSDLFLTPNNELIQVAGYSETDILALYPLRLDKVSGYTYTFGDCPEDPCFKLQYRGIGYAEGYPTAELSLSGLMSGNVTIGSAAISLGVPIRKGLGFQIKSDDVDIVVEIVEDRISQLKGRITLLKGSLREEGMEFNVIHIP